MMSHALDSHSTSSPPCSIGAVAALTPVGPGPPAQRARPSPTKPAVDRRHAPPAECQARRRARGHPGHPARGPRRRQQPCITTPWRLDDGTRVALRRRRRPAATCSPATASASRAPAPPRPCACRRPPRTASPASRSWPSPPCPTRSASQKTLVILVNFANDPAQPYTVAQARTGLCRARRLVPRGLLPADLPRHRRRRLVHAARSPPPPATSPSCNAKARQAATAAGVNLAPYIRQVYAFPFNASCPFAGMAIRRRRPLQCLDQRQYATPASSPMSSATPSASITPTPSSVTPPSSTSPCTARRVRRCHRRHGRRPRPLQRLPEAAPRLARLQRRPRPSPPSPASGTYTLDAYELPGTAPKALKIPRGTTGQSFFVELRRHAGLGCRPVSHRRLRPPRHRHPARQQHPPRHDAGDRRPLR